MKPQNTPRKIDARLSQKAEEKALERVALIEEDNQAISSEEPWLRFPQLQTYENDLETQDEDLRQFRVELAALRARNLDLYELAPIGYCTLTEEGTVLEANLAACILLGINRDELIGRQISRFSHPEDLDRYGLHKKRLIETARMQDFELRIVKSDTTVCNVDMTLLAAQKPDGTSVHRIVLRDITKRKLMEEALLYRLTIEELVTRISTRFVGIQDEEIAAQIEAAIQEVAEFANAKRVRMVLLSEDGKKYFKVYEWASDKSKKIKEVIEGQVVKIIPWLFNCLRMGKVVAISCVDDLPEQARVEKKIWKRLSVGSFVAIPLVRGETLLGYFGFDGENPGKTWKEEDIRLLRLVGEILINVLQLQEVKSNKKLLQAQLARQYSVENIVGKHGKMAELFRLIHKVAPENTTVMIYGETGVGKEQIARAIHQLSPRSSFPMYAVNCAAIPDHLLESELFGYERGAFTGAYARKKGILEEASGSTLFLDEVGDLMRPLQAKILRMLQEREIQRLGGKTRIRVDVRIISATHQDLAKLMTNGSFREDLYYRLNTFPLIVPPLRERTTDIPLLVNHFLQKYKNQNHLRAKKISFHALESLMAYPWPGNVRQLESAIERAVILAEGETISQEDLPQEVRLAAASHSPYGGVDFPDNGLNLEELEKYILARALEKSGGVIAKAARLLGITYRTLQYRMIKFGLTDYTKK